MNRAVRATVITCHLFALLATMTIANAGEPVLQGRLVSPTGAPITHFPVTVEGNNEKWVTTTDKQGNFIIESLPPGEYRVAPANEPAQRQSVTIEQAERNWYEFWKNEKTKPVVMQDMEIEAGKRY